MPARKLNPKPIGYCLEGGAVLRHRGDTWHRLTTAELLALPIHGPVWAWLRSQGMRRPSPSGPSGPTQPEDARGSLRVRVPREPVEALARRWGVEPSEAVTRAVREAGER